MRDGRVRRFMERWLMPWYDREQVRLDQAAAAEREQHSQQIAREAMGARIAAKEVRNAYAAAGNRVDRR